MRVASAASMKGKGPDLRRDAPTEGTKVRQIYDILLANRGVEIEFIAYEGSAAQLGVIFAQLRDYYGLDIRAYKQPGKIRKAYCLVGEYFGGDYVSYMNVGVQTCESPPVPERGKR